MTDRLLTENDLFHIWERLPEPKPHVVDFIISHYNTVIIPARIKEAEKKVIEETTIDVLHEVQKWLSGEQPKEKMAKRLELKLDALNAFLPSDNIPTERKKLIEELHKCYVECEHYQCAFYKDCYIQSNGFTLYCLRGQSFKQSKGV
jgi:hypothetical protein